MRELLLYFSCKYEGDWSKIYKAIKEQEKVDFELLKEYKEKVTSNYITILDDNYPKVLMNSVCPPYVFYYKGDISLISNNKKIAVIGARENSLYGEKMTKQLVMDLVNNGYIIISGLARGIDSIAHKECLSNDGKTIAIVGSGLNYTYPKENYTLQKEIEEKGLMISEYPDFVKPKPIHYPYRNRLIAAFANSILVTEAKYKSGTMITVRHGLNCGRDIFVVPHLAGSESGCNKLIKEGAQLVENVNDILNY